MNSKLNIVGKYKIWTVITLLVLVVGLVLFGILGFNQSVDYKNSYQVDVKIYSLDKSEDFAKEVVDQFFENSNVKSFNLTQNEDGFAILKYSFNNVVEFDANSLKDSIKTKLNQNNILLEVEDISVYQVQKTFFNKIGYVSLALGVGIVAIFIYLLLIEKLASAFAVAISGIISALLFVSLMAITRISASPFVWMMEVACVLLTVAISGGLTSRFREESSKADSLNQKATSGQISNVAIDASILRYVVITAFLVIGSVLLFAVGKGDYKILGLQLLVVSVVAIFSSIVWTPIMWCLIKKDKKSYKSQAKISE